MGTLRVLPWDGNIASVTRQGDWASRHLLNQLPASETSVREIDTDHCFHAFISSMPSTILIGYMYFTSEENMWRRFLMRQATRTSWIEETTSTQSTKNSESYWHSAQYFAPALVLDRYTRGA